MVVLGGENPAEPVASRVVMLEDPIRPMADPQRMSLVRVRSYTDQG